MQKHFVIPARILAYMSLGSALLLFTAPLEAKPPSAQALRSKVPKKRLSVLDYFHLLPSIGIGSPNEAETQQEKKAVLQPQGYPIIDVSNDYLRVKPDSSPAEEVAVFRARGKADLLAVSMPDYHSDYNFFALYRLQNGKLREVTRQILPMKADTGQLLYELPRFGTTIRVFRFDLDTQSRRHAFDLKWRGGRFVKVKAS